MNIHRKALACLWKDRCGIYVQQEVTDPETNLTDFQEVPLLEDQPCKLSFETLATTDENHAATATQIVKLFLSPDVVIPAGCKIIVRRFNEVERVFVFSQSGEAGVFTNHQEIILGLWDGWA